METPNNNRAYVRELEQEYVVVVNSKIIKSFTKFEDYASTDAKKFAKELNDKPK